MRKKQTLFVSVLAMLAGLGTLFLIDRSETDPNLLVPTVIAVVASAGLFSGAVWIARGRKECASRPDG